MNSSTLTWRSPASSFQTKELDLLSLAASCRWVNPAAFRAPTSALMSARCLELRSCFTAAPKMDAAQMTATTSCHRSLAAKESADVGEEDEVLRQGIRRLRDVHKEFDRCGTFVKTERSSS